MHIERLNPGDALRLKLLRLRALRHDPDAFGATYAAEVLFSEDVWLGRLTDEQTVFFVASVDGRDAGLNRFTARDGVAGLYSMWVDPGVRRRGVGRLLVEAVVDEARSRGHGSLLLEVVQSNVGAIRLYEQCGFEMTGRESRLPEPRQAVVELEMVCRIGE